MIILSPRGETPSSTADLYGEGKFVDFNATISNIYLADNQSINLGEYAPPVDENSGEQVLLDDDPHDPMELQVVPNVTAASSGGATVTVAGNYSGLPGQTPGWQVLVENGAGEGERLEIASAIYEDGDTQFTLAGTFAVTPAAGHLPEHQPGSVQRGVLRQQPEPQHGRQRHIRSRLNRV